MVETDPEVGDLLALLNAVTTKISPPPEGLTIVPATDSAGLTRVRVALRDALSGRSSSLLDRLLAAHPPRVRFVAGQPLATEPADPDSARAVAVWLIWRLGMDGRLTRLRICPGCGLAFFDTSRNGRRVWCSMNAQGQARGCGSLAKARTYRAKGPVVPKTLS